MELLHLNHQKVPNQPNQDEEKHLVGSSELNQADRKGPLRVFTQQPEEFHHKLP